MTLHPPSLITGIILTLICLFTPMAWMCWNGDCESVAFVDWEAIDELYRGATR